MPSSVGTGRRRRLQMPTAPGERRRVGGGEVEAHHPEQGVQEPFGLAQREMVEESQGQGGFDGEIRVPPLPTPPAASAGRPGRDRFRGHPHRHIAAANEGPVIGRPVRNAVLRLVRGMDLRLHPCRVAPAEGHEKSLKASDGVFPRAPPQGLHATTPLPLRQADEADQGGFASLHALFGMMRLDLSAPDYTTLSRRSQHLRRRLRPVPPGEGIHLVLDSTGLSIVASR